MNTFQSNAGVHFQVTGSGIPIMLGYPIMVTGTADDPACRVACDYFALLADRYRVLTMDYPNRGRDLGRSTPFPASAFSVERACKDLLEVADRAGLQTFVWWGFSWGGLIGIQLALRSKRVSALICGGWPPIGGPYQELLSGVRNAASDPSLDFSTPMDQFVTFYESMGRAPDEGVGKITCPKLVFIGADDNVEVGGIPLRLSGIVRERRAELERQGWCVAEIPGRDHSLYKDPTTVVPIVRAFLDGVT